VKDLADAAVYLDPIDPKAPLATDLLLGTQGWRRFAMMGLAKFVETYGDKATTMLAAKIPQQGFVGGFGGGGMEFEDALIVKKAGLQPNNNRVAFQLQGATNGIMPQFAAVDALAVPAPPPVAHAGAPAMIPPPAPASVPVAAPASLVAKDDDMDLKKVQQKQEVAWAAGDMPVVAGKIAMRANEMDFRARRVWNPNIMVREFAHQVRAGRKPNDRLDFAETLYWNAGVKTDPATGEAKVKFGLNDSVTTFRVFVDGFTSNGAVGAANIGVESVQPFYAEAKMPLEVTEGDHILLPISLVNATEKDFSNVDLSVNLSGVEKLAATEISSSSIGAGQRVRWIQPIDVVAGNSMKDLVFAAKTGLFSDTVARKLSIKSKGFPIETTFAGVLEPNKSVVHTIVIPDALVPGSLSTNTAVFPTPLANLTEALERMIQDPTGC
jgi:hypothetical protein